MIAVLPGMFSGALSVLLAVVVSFVLIVLIASYYRFLHIVQKAEDTQPEEMGVSSSDILRVQIARYLAGCARRNTSFSLAMIQVDDPSVEVRMESPFFEAIKRAGRAADITCVSDSRTAVFLAEAEPEDSEAILSRVIRMVAADCQGLAVESLRVGLSSYPGHGLSGRELLDVAQKGLAEANAEQPVFMPEIIDVDAEDEDEELLEEADASSDADDEEGKVKSWVARRKNVMLDELTGVLKPSAVSAYMQRMMSDLRHKKEKVALFCIGVNNVDHIARVHGEQAVDDVLVGISRILQDHVRSTDLIGRHEKYAFLILARISLENAEIIGKRVSTLIQQSGIVSGSKKIRTTITLGVAAYPMHGRNLHSLYSAGQKVLDYHRENDIRAYAVYDPEIHDKMPSKPMRNIKSVQT
ncbi:MAG: diguanylate cyclase [Verrucomicrobiota bacterium]